MPEQVSENCRACGHAEAEHILLTERGRGCIAWCCSNNYCLCDRYQGPNDPDECVISDPRKMGFTASRPT